MRKNNDTYTDGLQGQKNMTEQEQEGKLGSDASAETGEQPQVAEEKAKAEQTLELQQQIKALEQEKEELLARLTRLQADFDNYRKRTRAEREEIVEYATSELVCKLLPVIDNLERACASTEEKATEGIAEGIVKITKQLKELLEKEGLTAIECKGKPFDPQYHDAVMREESGEFPPDIVVDELQKGYMLKDKVIRPSMVKVSVKQ